MNQHVEPAGPCIMVIFGGAGDLTKRLLIPAINNLKRAKLLPRKFALIGIARSDNTEDSFRKELASGLAEFGGGHLSQSDRNWLLERIFYLQGTFDDPQTYVALKTLLDKTDAQYKTGGNILFYLATPAQSFAPIVEELSKAGLTQQNGKSWRRAIIEKPFGHDLPSAKALNSKLLSFLTEDQIYRIDHYLGKETVQNILIFRFANGIFEPLWNRDHIDHVQITVAETVAVGTRGKFYDATGALRDMVPNHLCQLLTMIAMEPPTRFDADALRTEKAKVLEAVQPFQGEDVTRNVVRAQYGAGKIAGATIKPFRKEDDVARDSSTETYVAMKLKIDNWRWAGVPFYLRTGKALTKRQTEVTIQFKQAPLALFRDTPVDRLTPNDLTIHIQPEEGVTLRLSAKIPGPDVHMGGVDMRFSYEDYFKAAPSTGYETLIFDCMKGDASLFQRADTIEGGWRIVQPLIEAWAAQDKAAKGKVDLPIYSAGSAGPQEADALLERDGRHWRSLSNTKAPVRGKQS